MLPPKIARGKALTYKAIDAIPKLIRRPSHLLRAARGVHWATLEFVDQPWLRRMNIRTVIDVGANTGQFATAAGVVFPSAHIYAFEPLPDCFDALQGRMKNHPRFTAWNVAIGDGEGEASFHRHSFSESSSLLPMLDEHRDAFPWTGDDTVVSVTVRTLDSFLGELMLEPPVLLKIDVQGYESRVLTGSTATLPQCDIVLLEVSFTPLYEGEASFEEVHKLMTSLGFAFSGLLDQLLHPSSGKVLQGDAIYLRRGSLQS